MPLHARPWAAGAGSDPSRPPPGFETLAEGPATVVVEPEFAASARALGLLAPGGLRRALDFAPVGGPAGRGQVALLPLAAGGTLCLRRLRPGGLLAPLRSDRLSSLARPMRELSLTAALHREGVPVPRPILVAAERGPGGFEAAVGTLLEPDARDALAFLEEAPARERMLRAAAAAGTALRRFHDAGGRHADLHVKNLLVRERERTLDVLVLDLDRGRRVADVTPAARMRELARLYRSLVKRGVLVRVGARGTARFFAAYTAGDRTLRRALRSRLAWLRLELALHGLHYRRAPGDARQGLRRRSR